MDIRRRWGKIRKTRIFALPLAGLLLTLPGLSLWASPPPPITPTRIAGSTIVNAEQLIERNRKTNPTLPP